MPYIMENGRLYKTEDEYRTADSSRRVAYLVTILNQIQRILRLYHSPRMNRVVAIVIPSHLIANADVLPAERHCE